jgi:hypothetical protein
MRTIERRVDMITRKTLGERELRSTMLRRVEEVMRLIACSQT